MEIRFTMLSGYFIAPPDNGNRDVRPSHVYADVCSLPQNLFQLRLETNPTAAIPAVRVIPSTLQPVRARLARHVSSKSQQPRPFILHN